MIVALLAAGCLLAGCEDPDAASSRESAPSDAGAEDLRETLFPNREATPAPTVTPAPAPTPAQDEEPRISAMMEVPARSGIGEAAFIISCIEGRRFPTVQVRFADYRFDPENTGPNLTYNFGGYSSGFRSFHGSHWSRSMHDGYHWRTANDPRGFLEDLETEGFGSLKFDVYDRGQHELYAYQFSLSAIWADLPQMPCYTGAVPLAEAPATAVPTAVATAPPPTAVPTMHPSATPLPTARPTPTPSPEFVVMAVQDWVWNNTGRVAELVTEAILASPETGEHVPAAVRDTFGQRLRDIIEDELGKDITFKVDFLEILSPVRYNTQVYVRGAVLLEIAPVQFAVPLIVIWDTEDFDVSHMEVDDFRVSVRYLR